MKFKPIVMLILALSAGVVEAQTAGILREYWTNVAGANISDLTNNSLYPCNPDGYSIESSFKSPVNWGDNYGTRMRGFVVPPVSGNYVFWICGDDNCELLLSTNDSPSEKILIAKVPGYTNELEWTKYSEQKSSAIYLETGKRYYIEALHKDGTQGDHVSVGWQIPGGALERPIGSSRLVTWPMQENYSEWNYSTLIRFNTTITGANIQNDVIDFPVLVQLGTDNSTIFAQALSNGNDIRFSDPDGTPLSFEIANWNSTLKRATIWVRVPRITAVKRSGFYKNALGESRGNAKVRSKCCFQSFQCFYRCLAS